MAGRPVVHTNTSCTICKRRFRLKGVLAADDPTGVLKAAKGLCSGCYQRTRSSSRGGTAAKADRKPGRGPGGQVTDPIQRGGFIVRGGDVFIPRGQMAKAVFAASTRFAGLDLQEIAHMLGAFDLAE